MSLRTSSERLAAQLMAASGDSAVLRAPISKVHALVDLLMQAPYLWTLLGSCQGTADFDKAIFGLVDAAVAARSAYFLHIVRQLVRDEFQANAEFPPSIMRSNGMCSRVLSHYAKRLGSKYIQKMLGNLLAEIALDEATKLDPQDSDSPSEEKEAQLVKKVSLFFNRIVADDFLREMPPEIKAITGFVEEMSAAFCPDHTCPLLGGFLLLRFINPHIVSPDAHGILPADQLKSVQRHNLVLIGKTLQQISNQNQEQQGRGAASFPVLQEWISSNQSRMITFLFNVATEGRRAWTSDYSASQPRALPFSAVKFEDYLLLHSFFGSNCAKLTATVEAQKSKAEYAERSAVFSAFTKLLEEITNTPLRPANTMELIYSPLDPDSRAVQLLLLDLKAEFTSRRVDPLHSTASLENIIRGRSPFKRLPYLLDGDTVLSGGCAILRYLAVKFFIQDSWYPASPQQRVVIDQTLDWLTTSVHQPVALLFTRGLESGVDQATACPVDLSRALEAIETRLHHGFLFGGRMSIADLLLVCHLSCYSVFMPEALSAYPLIQQLRTVAEDRLSGWRIIHKEFELLRQYAIVERHHSSVAALRHSVYFPMPPHEVYETLMDPDMFPTGFERNATLVPRTPRGSSKQPVISREVGGRFVVPLRNGVQLLLLPDVKIVQKSTNTEWPDGVLPSVDVYELKPFEKHTLLRFSQLNIPEDNMKQLDEQWDRFWRKMRGIRTTDIQGNLCFPNVSPKLFFDTYLDGERMSTLLKKPCTVKRGNLEHFTLLDSAASGQTLHIIPHQTIVQKWRASDWPEGHFSLLTLELRSMDSAGSLLSLSQTNVPQDREKSTLKLLNRVWRALGGIAVQNVVHAVFVPDNRARVWKTVSEAKHVRENVPQGGSEFKMFGSLLHGSHKEVSPPFLSVQTQQYHHKEWPSDYYCDTSIEFNEHDNDTTLMRLTHHNLPEDFTKIALDAWETLWSKIPGACRVENISRTIAFPATTHRVYDFLLSSDEVGRALRASNCIIQRRLNSSWLVADGKTEFSGTLQRFAQDRLITMTWRASDWPPQHSSLVSIKLSPWTSGDNSCLVWLQQFRVPIGRMKETNAFWERLWTALADAVKPR